MLSTAADAQEGNWVINWSATGRWRAPRVRPCWRGWVLIQIGWRNIFVAIVCIQDEWQWPSNKIRSLIFFFNWNDACNWKLKRPFTLQKKLLAGANLFSWISFFSNKLPMRVLGKVQRAAVGDATHTRERILRFWFQTDDLILCSWLQEKITLCHFPNNVSLPRWIICHTFALWQPVIIFIRAQCDDC